MLRRGEDSGCGANFCDATGVENENAICEAGEKSGIVGDENHGEADVLSEGAEKLDNLLLRCWIQRRRRLIGNDEGRAACSGLSDENALTLAAAQLVRIGAGNASGVSGKDGSKQVARLLLKRKSVKIFVRCQNITDLPAYLESWMERRSGFLKDQTDAPTTNSAEIVRRGLQEIFSFEKDGTTFNLSGGRQKPQQRGGECALAGARFTKNAKEFSRVERKVDTRQGRGEFARAGGVRDVEVLDFQKRLHAMDQWRLISRQYSWSVKGVKWTRSTIFPAQESY